MCGSDGGGTAVTAVLFMSACEGVCMCVFVCICVYVYGLALCMLHSNQHSAVHWSHCTRRPGKAGFWCCFHLFFCAPLSRPLPLSGRAMPRPDARVCTVCAVTTAPYTYC